MNESTAHAGHGTCGGKTRSGAPCKLPAGHGTSHPGWGRCDHHGGATPNHVASAAEAQARQACEKFGLPVRTTAAQALQAELDRTNGVILYLMRRVQALGDDGLTWGTEKRTVRTNPGMGAIRGEPQIEVTQQARPHVLVLMLERERRHLAAVATEMARIGIEARVVRVTETQLMLLNRVLDAVLSDNGVDTRDPQVAAGIVRRLREVSAG